MKVTRDVVKDLLAVYAAGEASADTGALVEEWLRSDPELAGQAARADGGRGDHRMIFESGRGGCGGV